MFPIYLLMQISSGIVTNRAVQEQWSTTGIFEKLFQHCV